MKKLRLALLLAGVGTLAVISTIFGMMMAVASDLEGLEIENQRKFTRAANSLLLASDGSRIAKLTGNQNQILIREKYISPNLKNAVIAVEDRRFYDHKGVDYRGIARALWADVRQQRAVQGGSTITQQFVKNATAAQGDRSVMQKLREAALAYHLERKWTKQKILTQYLNSVYFGNGAHGVESAVRTYFRGGSQTTGGPLIGQDAEPDVSTEEKAAANVTPAQAALLAGMIASPSAYDPLQNPIAARERRDLVLTRMLEQETITRAEYERAVKEALPNVDDVKPPQPVSNEPYFSTWVTQQLVDRFGAENVFFGGLRIKTTLDPEMQAAAEQAINGRLSGVGPRASLVLIENRTGKVRALVGGDSFSKKPFNLATNGHRQPGSAFKAFTLVTALQRGIGPGAVFASRKKVFPVPGSRKEKFVVNNYESNYSGSASVASATAASDNSVFAELGLKVGTKRIANMAERLGVKTPISTNPAMTLGGLKEGVTPLEMAYAYSTIANGGLRVSGTLASYKERGEPIGGPVAIEAVDGSGDERRNKVKTRRVYNGYVGEQARQVLSGVVRNGTGKKAQLDEFVAGKTGTTENYGDAWFVGFTEQYTAAVWVGYPDEVKYMETDYHGSEVAGGTYPTEIWRDLMVATLKIRDARKAAKEAKKKAREGDGAEDSGDGAPGPPGAPGPAPAPAPQGPAPAPTPQREEAPAEPRRDPAPPRRETPAPEQPAEPPAQPAPGGGATPVPTQ